MLNITHLIFRYVPIAVTGVYLSSVAFNLFEINSRISSIITDNTLSANFYSTMAIVSVAMMGFLIVALPLIGDAFSKEKLGRVLTEFYEKDGVTLLLRRLMQTIALSGILFSLSLVGFVLNLSSNFGFFVIMSVIALDSIVFLAGSLLILYAAIQATRPSLRIRNEVTA